MMKTIQNFMEQRAYGVCSKLGERLGISSSSIRLYFIYTSFLAFGSPIIVYLVLAFWLNIRKYLRRQRNFVREL
jgi:phage shock protein PspC (stress-responsive transcriptional regulator)